MTLDEDDHLAGAVAPRSTNSIAELLATVVGPGQEVGAGDGHAQVGVLVHGGVLALDGRVVDGLIAEQEVLQDKYD